MTYQETPSLPQPRDRPVLLRNIGTRRDLASLSDARAIAQYEARARAGGGTAAAWQPALVRGRSEQEALKLRVRVESPAR